MTRIVMASIVDPSVQVGGAWTMTRGLLRLLREAPLSAEVEVVASRARSRRTHGIRRATAVARALLSGVPSKIVFSRDRRIRSEILQLLREQPFDLVVLNGADLLWLLPDLPPGIPRILVAHNIEHELFAAQLEWGLASWGPIARLLRRDHERLRRYEHDGFRRVGNVIFLSSQDERYAHERTPGLRTLTLPPIFDEPPGRSEDPAGGGEPRSTTETLHMGMLANFEWWPNRQGLEWFASEILPQLSENHRLHLYGRGSHRVAPRDQRVIPHGPVDHADEVWSACDLMICPVLSGGGVSIKLAEAVYRRVPVIATHFTAAGLPLEPHPSIVLLDDAAAWAEQLNERGWDLARQTVPVELAARFDIDTHRNAVGDFVRCVLTSPSGLA